MHYAYCPNATSVSNLLRARFGCPIAFFLMPLMPAPDSPPPTVADLIERANLSGTYIVQKLGLNQRTVKLRVAQPWLFTATELFKLAALLPACPVHQLLDVVLAQSRREGDLSPTYQAGPQHVGRRRLKPRTEGKN